MSPESDLAVVLASHGDRAGSAPNAALLRHADVVRNLVRLCVTAGVLKGEPSFETALEDAHASGARDVLVYPLFMAEGYFTGAVLPERVHAAGRAATTRILPPLGLDPGMPELMLGDALTAAARAGREPREARLLVVGHGSKFGPASAEATRDVAEKLAGAGRFATVATAFLEEEPFLDSALRVPGPPTIVSGFFFGDGMHAGEDVPAAIAATGADAVYAGPVGRSPGIPALIAAALRAAAREAGVRPHCLT